MMILFFMGQEQGGRFSLFDVGFVAYKSSMLVHLLQSLCNSWLFFYLGLASSNLAEYIMAPPRVYLFLPCKQPKNLENVINLKTLFKTSSWIVIIEYINL
jgi:hypothetical protein